MMNTTDLKELLVNIKVSKIKLGKMLFLFRKDSDEFMEIDRKYIEYLMSRNKIEDEDLEIVKKTSYEVIKLDMFILQLNNLIEGVITDIINFHIINFNDKKNIHVPLSELINEFELEKLLKIHLNRHSEEKILNLNFHQKIKYLFDKCGFEIIEYERIKESIFLIREMRNLISHNNSIINESFSKNFGIEYGQVGNRLNLTFNETGDFVFDILKFINSLGINCHYKFSIKSDYSEESTTNLLISGYDSILESISDNTEHTLSHFKTHISFEISKYFIVQCICLEKENKKYFYECLLLWTDLLFNYFREGKIEVEEYFRDNQTITNLYEKEFINEDILLGVMEYYNSGDRNTLKKLEIDEVGIIGSRRNEIYKILSIPERFGLTIWERVLLTYISNIQLLEE